MANNQLGVFWTVLPDTARYIAGNTDSPPPAPVGDGGGIVLAGGGAKYRLRFSATVAFRLLRGDGRINAMTLDAFPALLDWPALINSDSTNFALDLQFGQDFPFRPPVTLVSTPVSDAWKKLFLASTVVKPQPPSSYNARDVKRIRSYPRREIGAFVRGLHVGTQTQGVPANSVVTSPIPGPVLNTAFETIRPYRTTSFVQQVNSFISLQANQPDSWVITRADRNQLSNTLAVASDFVQLNTYYRRRSDSENPLGDREVRDRPEFPTQDFHQLAALALLQPRVARELGLILDFELELPAGLAGDGVMSLFADYTPTGLDRADVYYSTAYSLGEDGFEIRAGDPNFDGKGRYLRLADTRLFDFEDGLDVDSAALKAADLEEGITDLSKPSDLPALRTTGLGINRTDNSLRLADQRHRDRLRFNSAFGNNSPVPTGGSSLSADDRVENPEYINYAEDLVRGYRFDVWDSVNERWSSLHQRSGEYRIGAPGDEYIVTVGTSDAAPLDEGFVSTVPTRPTAVFKDQAPPDDYFLSESLMRWNGWSLSVPRLGAPITNDDKTMGRGNDSLPAFPRPSQAAGRVLTNMRRAHNLPRLRFGREYQFRARIVDTAGNSVPFDPWVLPGDLGDAASEVVKFRRYDPVESPTLIFREPPTVGEGVYELVVRSEDGVEFSGGVSRRLIAPAATSQWMAECHGLFDPSIDGRHVDAANQYTDLLVKLEGKSWASSALYTLIGGDADGAFRLPPPGSDDPPEDPLPPGTKPSGQFMIPLQPDDDLVELPYLADPAAYQVQVQRLPGNQAKFLQYGPGYWPNQTAAKIELLKSRELVGPGSSSVDDNWGDTLQVTLTKGDVRTLLMSSALEDEVDNDPNDPDFINADKFGLFNWTVQRILEIFPDTVEGDVRSVIGPLVQSGLHRAITPPQEVRLVHAVRKPLAPPNFEFFGNASSPFGWQIERRAGETVGRANGQIGYSAKSTGRIDVRATWTNTIDEGPYGPDPRVGKPKAVNVWSSELDRSEVAAGLDVDHDYVRVVDAQHEIGDTRHHVVKYFPKATTAFLPYFREEKKVTFTSIAPSQSLFASPISIAPITVTGDSGRVYVEGAEYTINREVGSIKRVPNAISPINEPVTVSFIRGVIDWEAASTSRHVLSTKRPDPPILHSLVPTFTWDQTFTPVNGQRPAMKTSTRSAGGLRIWLERPWWSSGEDEKLGIIVSPAGTPAIKDSWDFVSSSGTDATSDSRNTKRFLTASDFTGNDPAVRVSLAENGRQFEVVPYSVQFDVDRDQWYADIQVNPALGGTVGYFPFVRLALVRFQPFSIYTDDFAKSPSTNAVLGDKQGLHLSSVLLTDFIQVAPQRQTFVTKSGRTVAIRVNGDSYVTLQDEAALTPRPAGRGPTDIRVTLQQRNPAINDPELAWSSVGSGDGLASLRAITATLTPSPAASGDRYLFNWTGNITLPTTRVGQTPPDYRLLIEEFETHYSDADGRQGTLPKIDATAGGQVKIIPQPDHQLPSARRCVFQDTIPLAGL